MCSRSTALTLILTTLANPVRGGWLVPTSTPSNGKFWGELCLEGPPVSAVCGWKLIVTSSPALTSIMLFSTKVNREDKGRIFYVTPKKSIMSLPKINESYCLRGALSGDFGDTTPDYVDVNWHCICVNVSEGCQQISTWLNETENNTSENLHTTERAPITSSQTASSSASFRQNTTFTNTMEKNYNLSVQQSVLNDSDSEDLRTVSRNANMRQATYRRHQGLCPEKVNYTMTTQHKLDCFIKCLSIADCRGITMETDMQHAESGNRRCSMALHEDDKVNNSVSNSCAYWQML